jgi:two-component system nitrate/nitrite response regulator NarL
MGKIGVFLVGSDLSAREEKILRLLVVGFSNREIARDLDINVATVKAEMRQLLRKVKARSETLRSIDAQPLGTH